MTLEGRATRGLRGTRGARGLVPRLAASLALALLVSMLVAPEGHADGELEVRIERFVESPDALSLTLSVLDAGGNPVSNLDASGVIVRDNGESLPVQLVATEGAELGVATFLGVDVSGSMAASLSDARAGIGLLVASMRPFDTSALVAFSDSVRTVAELGASPEATLAGLATLEARGGTHLFDATRQLASSASASASERKVVILLSDGRDEGSTTARAEALATAIESRVPFYVVAMGSDVDTAFLEQLANETGGVYLRAATSADLVPAYEAVTRRLRTQYVLTAHPSPATASEERLLEVTVTTAAGSGRIERRYQRSASPTLEAAPAPAVEPAVEAPSTAQPSTGSPSVDARLLALGAALAVLAVVVWRRRARVATPEGPALAVRARPASQRSSGAAILRPLDGPIDGSLEGSVRLQAEVVSIDASGELRNGPLDPRRAGAQLWWRDGKLMLHRVGDPTSGLTVWSSAVPGDVLELGGRRFRLELERPE